MRADFLAASYCISRAASDVGVGALDMRFSPDLCLTSGQDGPGLSAVQPCLCSRLKEKRAALCGTARITACVSDLLVVAHVCESALDRGSCRHRRAHQMGAASAALAALEVAVR